MIQPLNKYLVVDPTEDEVEKRPALLMPEGVNSDPPFKVVTLVQANEQCTLPQNARLIVPSHAIEQIEIKNSRYYLVLENFVVGYLNE